jgi:preprotein translocase subunit SecA
MTQLLKAYTLFDRDTEYVVIDNKVKIVDEQTGRYLREDAILMSPPGY